MTKKKAFYVDPRTGASHEYEGRWSLNSVTKKATFEEAEAGTTTVFSCGVVIHDPAGKVQSEQSMHWKERMIWLAICVGTTVFIQAIVRLST